MNVKGATNGSPFVLEEDIASAVSRLCDVFAGANPRLDKEDDAMIAENETQTVLFRGTPEELACLNEASKLVVAKHEKLNGSLAADSPSSYKVRREMEALKVDIIAAMTHRAQCAPKSTLQEAYSRVGS